MNLICQDDHIYRALLSAYVVSGNFAAIPTVLHDMKLGICGGVCARNHFYFRSSGVGYGRRLFNDMFTWAAKYGKTDLAVQVAALCYLFIF